MAARLDGRVYQFTYQNGVRSTARRLVRASTWGGADGSELEAAASAAL
jgi:hypothetical protein